MPKLFILNALENIIVSSTNSAVSNYESLISSMNHYRDIIVSNRSELHPVEDFVEETLEEDADTFEE